MDASGFDFSLKNNKTTLQSRLLESPNASEDEVTVYGALLQAQNAPFGVGTITANEISVQTLTQSSTTIPHLIGGAAILDNTSKNITSQTHLDSNKVSVVSSSTTGMMANNITGGLVQTNLHKNRTYNLSYNIENSLISINNNNGTFTGEITGGKAVVNTDGLYTVTLAGDVQSNEIQIAGGTFDGAVLIGGHATLEGEGLSSSSTLPISVHNNILNISGGTLKDTLIIGGATTKTSGRKDIAGNIYGNTVSISGTTSLQGKTTLVGGYTTGANTLSNNMLNLQTSGHTVYGVDGFDTYKFDVSGANANDTFLTVTHGNGHNQEYFLNYEDSVRNNALNLTNASIDWQTYGRPTNLNVGESVTLIHQTGSEGVTGTIANNNVSTPIIDTGVTYSYKLLQDGTLVRLFHHALNTSGNWTQDLFAQSGDFANGDTSVTIGGTLKATQIGIAKTSQSSIQVTADILDVTTQDTNLQLGYNGYSINDNTLITPEVLANFNTINVGNGQTLTAISSAPTFYSFSTMNIDGTGQVTDLQTFNASGSTVNLTSGATPHFDNITLGNGTTLTIPSGNYDFNTLRVLNHGNTLNSDLNANGKNISFLLADNTTSANTALTVNGTADITNAQVQVGIMGTSSPLRKQDQVVLLDSSSITGTPANTTHVGYQQLFLKYDFDLDVVGNQLIATVTKAGLSPESKSFLEGRAAALGLVGGQGADFVTDQAMDSALQAAALEQTQRLALFSAFGGGKSRYETGSHVDVNGFNAAVGLAHDVTILSADFMLASFVEYGTGSYNSYNSFASGDLKGSGDTDYFGLGAMGRWLGENNTYVEGSARVGRLSTDFKAPVFFTYRNASYDYKTLYYGAHVGLGYVYDGLGDSTLDFYAKYLFTQQQEKNVSISSGDRLHFSSSTSSRVRAGFEANLAPSATWQPRLGLAYDYEMNGKANASAYAMSWDAPSLQGGTAVGDANLTYLHGDWMFTLGAQGFVGQRKGFSGNFQLGYKF